MTTSHLQCLHHKAAGKDRKQQTKPTHSFTLYIAFELPSRINKGGETYKGYSVAVLYVSSAVAAAALQNRKWADKLNGQGIFNSIRGRLN